MIAPSQSLSLDILQDLASEVSSAQLSPCVFLSRPADLLQPCHNHLAENPDGHRSLGEYMYLPPHILDLGSGLAVGLVRLHESNIHVHHTHSHHVLTLFPGCLSADGNEPNERQTNCCLSMKLILLVENVLRNEEKIK